MEALVTGAALSLRGSRTRSRSRAEWSGEREGARGVSGVSGVSGMLLLLDEE